MNHFEKSCRKFSGPAGKRSVLIRNNRRRFKERGNQISLGYDNEKKVYIDSTPKHLSVENDPYSVHYDYSNGTMVSPVGWS